jgi:hypothetical protein
MANPMQNSPDAHDFLEDFKKKTNMKSKLAEHQDIVKEFGENYERAYQQLNTFQAEAYRDEAYFLGYQWSLEELAYLNNQRRSSFTYNMIRRIITLVDGIQRQNQLGSRVTGIEDADEETADVLSSVLQYVMEYGGGYEKKNDAFKDALIAGISFISPYIDYRDDPVSGDVKFKLDQWNSAMWDPFYYEPDLSDCSFFSRRKYLSRTEVVSLLPNQEDIINQLSYGTRDDKFTYLPFARQWGLQKLMNYTEYWRRSWKVKNVLVDMESGEVTEWKGDNERLKHLKLIHPAFEIMRKPVKTVELGIIVEGELLYYGQDPYGLDDYPFVPCYGGEFRPSFDLYTWKLQGLVRFVRDPQTELNKRRSKMVDILDAQLNSGWIAKTGAVTNQNSLFKSGNGQVIFLKPEANMEDIQRLNAPDIPQGQFALMDAFEKDIPNILGINPEMLGMPENEKVETAAILAKMRQSAGLISLRGIFDGLATTQKILSRKVLKLIQKNYTPEKIRLITKKEPTAEFYSQAFARYDVVVEEGVLTDTQRQAQFSQLLALKTMGFNIPESLIIEKSSLQGKRELNEILDAEADQQNQMMQEQQAKEQEVLRMQAVGIEAKAKNDQALAMMHMSEINLKNAENAERIQRAEEDRTAAQLNFIKALKELQEMDLNGMTQKINMLKELGTIQSAEGDQKRVQVEHEMAMAQAQQQMMMQGQQHEQMMQQPQQSAGP